MRVPGSLIVPDPRPPPVFLLGAGALLLAGLVIRTLRRRRTRSSRRGGTRPGDTVRGSWRLVPEGSVSLESLRPLTVPVPVGRVRGEEGAQKRGRATKKRP